jgi:hypothetical protein
MLIRVGKLVFSKWKQHIISAYKYSYHKDAPRNRDKILSLIVFKSRNVWQYISLCRLQEPMNEQNSLLSPISSTQAITVPDLIRS